MMVHWAQFGHRSGACGANLAGGSYSPSRENVTCEACRWKLGDVLRVMRTDRRAVVPVYQTDGASGLDLHALDVVASYASEDGHRERWKLPRILHVGESILLGTGIAIALPPGHEAQVRPRSSLAAKWGVVATMGTIDNDYRGEILVQLIAHCRPLSIQEGDRIAQLVVAPVTRVSVQVVDELDATARGAGGIGSTGR